MIVIYKVYIHRIRFNICIHNNKVEHKEVAGV